MAKIPRPWLRRWLSRLVSIASHAWMVIVLGGGQSVGAPACISKHSSPLLFGVGLSSDPATIAQSITSFPQVRDVSRRSYKNGRSEQRLNMADGTFIRVVSGPGPATQSIVFLSFDLVGNDKVSQVERVVDSELGKPDWQDGPKGRRAKRMIWGGFPAPDAGIEPCGNGQNVVELVLGDRGSAHISLARPDWFSK